MNEQDKHWYKIMRRNQEACWANDPASQMDLEDMLEDEIKKMESEKAKSQG